MKIRTIQFGFVLTVFLFGFNATYADEKFGIKDYSLNYNESCYNELTEVDSFGVSCVIQKSLNQVYGSTSQFGRKPTIRSYSTSSDHLSTKFDTFYPLFSSSSIDGNNSTLFLQQGVTNWRDRSNTDRRDFRLGTVYRFSPNADSDKHSVGITTLLQSNLESAHETFVSRVDYSANWGSGSLVFHVPISDELTNSFGTQERALKGTELGLSFGLTDSLIFNFTRYRRQSQDDEDGWEDGSRMGLSWSYKNRFKFNTSIDDSPSLNSDEDEYSFWAEIEIPLGNH